MKPTNFTKNEHHILSLRISDLFWSIKICPWQFFSKVRNIFGICFQLNLFVEVSLIFVKNYVDSAFSNRFYILYHVHQRKTIYAGAYFKEFYSRKESKFMDLQEIIAKKDYYLVITVLQHWRIVYSIFI